MPLFELALTFVIPSLLASLKCASPLCNRFLMDGSVMVADEIENISSVILLNSNLEFKEFLSKEEH